MNPDTVLAVLLLKLFIIALIFAFFFITGRRFDLHFKMIKRQGEEILKLYDRIREIQERELARLERECAPKS